MFPPRVLTESSKVAQFKGQIEVYGKGDQRRVSFLWPTYEK